MCVCVCILCYTSCASVSWLRKETVWLVAVVVVSNSCEYHSLPATINDELTNQVYQMNMADTSHSTSMCRQSSIKLLTRSNSAPVLMFDGSLETDQGGSVCVYVCVYYAILLVLV